MAYLYTPAEDFCCTSGPSGGGSFGAEMLAPPQSDFMDLMTNQGEIEFRGDFMTGKVKAYVLHLPEFEPVGCFWYLTTLDNKPVAQGEGGSTGAGLSICRGGAGIPVWHNYNTTSFQAVTHDPSVFAVPQVCKNTQIDCSF